MDIGQLSGEFASQLDESGVVAAIPIAILSMVLLLQGYRRLQIVTMVVGGAVGYVIAPILIASLDGFGLTIDPLHLTLIICLLGGLMLSATVLASARLLTSALIFVSFSTVIEILNNYGFDVERSELWSGIAALCALFFTMGINRLLPAIYSAIFAAYGLLVTGLLLTGNSVATFEPVEGKTFVLITPLAVFSLKLQNADRAKRLEQEFGVVDNDSPANDYEQYYQPLT